MSILDNTFCSTLYACDCGYSTINKSNANKHVKTNKCLEKKISKKKINFTINDEKILNLVAGSKNTEIDVDLESCSSAESNLSIISDSAEVIKQSRDIPGMVCYVYDKTYANRATIRTTTVCDTNEIYSLYKNVFRDPGIISIYVPDIKNIDTFVKNELNKNNMLDNDYVIHGMEAIIKFSECVSQYSVSRWGSRDEGTDIE